jgi:hypothetical protein
MYLGVSYADQRSLIKLMHDKTCFGLQRTHLYRYSSHIPLGMNRNLPVILDISIPLLYLLMRVEIYHLSTVPVMSEIDPGRSSAVIFLSHG